MYHQMRKTSTEYSDCNGTRNSDTSNHDDYNNCTSYNNNKNDKDSNINYKYSNINSKYDNTCITTTNNNNNTDNNRSIRSPQCSQVPPLACLPSLALSPCLSSLSLFSCAFLLAIVPFLFPPCSVLYPSLYAHSTHSC
jgi:hypothetical protein